jgi:magnesium chelatase subunit I
MPSSRPSTVGELKASGHRTLPVKDELRKNLVRKLRAGGELFPGIVGYDNTVVPQLVNAVLARHDFVLLGLRGQAKSRILRQLVELLDSELPILAGSEVNDDPLCPISKQGRLLMEEMGDEAPLEWISREYRYVEKLATPDVTIADMIGDVDPIKAARGGHILADELTIHYGLLPRANRGIFAINELPDLAGKIQVGLFNILQEGDVQIKGYPIRLPLDVYMVFTANPEDYTARGKIITPLKDRIGGEIRTHYPLEVATGVAITQQEAWVERQELPVHIPDFMEEVVERVAFLARADTRIDQRSGVSQRLPITLTENLVSTQPERVGLMWRRSWPISKREGRYRFPRRVPLRLAWKPSNSFQGCSTWWNGWGSLPRRHPRGCRLPLVSWYWRLWLQIAASAEPKPGTKNLRSRSREALHRCSDLP